MSTRLNLVKGWLKTRLASLQGYHAEYSIQHVAADWGTDQQRSLSKSKAIFFFKSPLHFECKLLLWTIDTFSKSFSGKDMVEKQGTLQLQSAPIYLVTIAAFP